MNLADQIPKVAAEASGKGGIVYLLSSWFGVVGEVPWFQVISAMGVLWLMLDRGVRLYWDAKDRKNGNH